MRPYGSATPPVRISAKSVFAAKQNVFPKQNLAKVKQNEQLHPAPLAHARLEQN
jgi:hypothetical protein